MIVDALWCKGSVERDSDRLIRAPFPSSHLDVFDFSGIELGAFSGYSRS